MKLNWSQVIFYYIFDVLLLLLFFFGESFLGLYVMGAFAIFFLYYSRHLDWSKVSLYKKELVSWLLFLVGLFVTSFFTLNIPLTINALVFYTFAFAVFFFFLTAPRQIFQINFLLWNLILVVVGLGIVGLGFALIPGLAKELPGMNLIYATYGHNHYGALMILLIPVTWYFLLKNLADRRKLALFFLALMFMVLNLILSFGRVVIFLGFAELLVLFVLTAKTMPWVNKKIKIFFVFLLMVMALVFLLKNSFTLVSYWYKDIQCPFPKYKDRICKNLSSDLRFSYWQTALKAFADRPLVGFGPGTYKLVSERFKTRPDAGTSYAHNVFLQMIAEGGVMLGLPFILLIGSLLYKPVLLLVRNYSIEVLNRKVLNWRLFVALGLMASLINSLFDFDWSFVGVFSVFLILSVIVIREEKKHDQIMSVVLVEKIAYFLSLAFIIVLMITSLIVELLIWRGKTDVAAQFFPYFQIHMQVFLESDQLSEQDKQKISQYYSQTAYIYLQDESTGVRSWPILDKIAPWHFYEANAVKSVASSDAAQVKLQLERTAQLYKQAEKQGYKGLVASDRNLSTTAIATADEFLAKGDYSSAVGLYQTALVFDEWVLNDTYPRFLFDLKTIEQKKQFWELMSSFPSKNYGKFTSTIYDTYFSLLRTAVDQRDWPKAELWFDELLEITPEFNDDLIVKIVPKLQAIADEAVRDRDFVLAERVLRLEAKTKTYYCQSQLGNLFLLMGEADRAKQEYMACNELWKQHYGQVHGDCESMANEDLSQSSSLPYWLTSQEIQSK